MNVHTDIQPIVEQLNYTIFQIGSDDPAMSHKLRQELIEKVQHTMKLLQAIEEIDSAIDVYMLDQAEKKKQIKL